MLLTLPVLAPEVPVHLAFGGPTPAHLRMMLALSRSGMVTDDDLSALCGPIKTPALVALTETAWARQIGGIFSFRALSAYCRLVLPGSDNTDFVDDEGQLQPAFIIDAGQPDFISIGLAMEALEHAMPGLGSKALAIMDSALYCFGPPHTPSGALDLSRMHYWLGEDDETVAYEEYGPDAEVPTRKDLFGSFPEWCYDYTKAPPVSDKDLSAAAERLSGEVCGPLLLALDHLNGCLHQQKPDSLNWSVTDGDPYPQSPPIALGWYNDDDFMRIFDDNYQSVMDYGEVAPWIARINLVPSSEGISAALSALEYAGNILKALDTVLIIAKDLHNEL